MSNKYCIFLGMLSLMLLAISYLGFEIKDNPLSNSEGTLVSYSFGRGGDLSIILKDRQDDLYKKFDFLQFRSYLDGKIEPYKGRLIRLDHYDRIVANCWADGKQFCFSKCESDRECRIAQNKSAAIWLHSVSAVLAVLVLISLIWRRIKRR